MSFILDALKKSESDRQRQSGPSLFEVKVAPPRRTLPIWAVAIAVLLGINVIVVTWMLLRRPAAPQPTAAAPGGSPPAAIPAATGPRAPTAQRAPASAAPPQAPPAAGTAPSTPAAPPSGAAASPPPHSAGAPAANDQNSGPAAAGGDPSDYAPAVEPSEAGGAGTGGGSADTALPLYQQIVDSAGLPALHLDLHVFADRPRDRFVMINMHRLGEGDSLPEGVHVDTIRPDGVVLTFHGKRFLLPRN
jgi:general secretion pathway protein B